MLNCGLKVVPIIHKYIQEGHNVLVHCVAGVQRSASIVAMYLMKYYGFNLEDSVKFIRSRRPVSFYGYLNPSGKININFYQALLIFSKLVE